MKRLLTHRASLVLFLLCVACSDEDPTQPSADEPLEYVAPNTGENCVPGCLRDDIPGWTVIGLTTSGRRIELEDVYDPTTRGAVVDATYCWYRTSDNYFLGCQKPSHWTTGHAEAPDGRVRITGYELSGAARVRFTGYAPLPQVELLEYERPDQPNCSGSSMIYCYGTYRLKVSLRNAGWYNTDRLTAFGENADGQRWELSDVGHVVNYGEETVEWNWTQVHPGTPGSRIVVAYYPWSASYAGRLELSVPLYDATPALTLDATPAPISAPEAGGPMAIQVESGTPVIFEPQAPGSLIEIIGWTWTPADTTGARTEACSMDQNSCTTPVYENGTMEVTARVDGQVREATAQVSVEPDWMLVCTPTIVVRGDPVACVVSSRSGAAYNAVHWSFSGARVPIESIGDSLTWSGPLVKSGTVNAVVHRGEMRDNLSAEVAAAPRMWTGQVPSFTVIEYPRCDSTTRTPECPLLYPPLVDADMGVHNVLPREFDLAPLLTQVEQGPNAGLIYIDSETGPLRHTHHVISLNPVLQDPADLWWDTGVTTCTPQEARETVLTHEQHHADLFDQNWPNHPIHSVIEELVFTGSLSKSVDIVRSMQRTINDWADTASDIAELYNPPQDCSFNFSGVNP